MDCVREANTDNPRITLAKCICAEGKVRLSRAGQWWFLATWATNRIPWTVWCNQWILRLMVFLTN